MDGRYQLPDPSATATPEGIAVDEHAHRVCRVLLAGLGERGQPQVAGALLQLLGSSVNVATVSLAQIVVAGSGDPAVGCISTVRQAVKRCLIPMFLQRACTSHLKHTFGQSCTFRQKDHTSGIHGFTGLHRGN